MQIFSLTSLRYIVGGILLCSSLNVQAEMKIGDPAPDFQVSTFDDQKLSLAEFRGKVLLINFWATWCAPCREEMPTIDAFYRLTEQHGMRVIAVTTEDTVPPYALKKLQRVLKIPLARRFVGKYGALNRAVPSNFVIDRTGVIRYAKAGSLDLDDLNRILIPLLREPVPSDSASGRVPGVTR